MGEYFNYDFRTPLQKQQDERKKNIIAMFADFRAKAPAETSDSRIMLAVSQRVGCTQQNVRVILIKAGVITPKKRRAAVPSVRDCLVKAGVLPKKRRAAVRK